MRPFASPTSRSAKLNDDARWAARPELILFQLPNPLLQELPLRFLLGQRQRLLIRRSGLGCSAEPAVHIGAGEMRQVVIR